MRLAHLLTAIIALFMIGCAGDNPPLTCTSDDQCLEYYRCDNRATGSLSPQYAPTNTCLRQCTVDAEQDCDDQPTLCCLDSQYCDPGASTNTAPCEGSSSTDPPCGVCRDLKDRPGGDPPGGDPVGGDPGGDPAGGD